VGVPNPPNKYLVLALSLFVIIVFYFLLLSHFPNLLAKGINPLTAAATQCLRFSLISAVVILLAIFAMSGFDFSYIGSTFTNNVGLIIFIAVVWLIYLTISISNKSKGAAK
jgi:flagellar biosynthesis protein FlhB